MYADILTICTRDNMLGSSSSADLPKPSAQALSSTLDWMTAKLYVKTRPGIFKVQRVIMVTHRCTSDGVIIFSISWIGGRTYEDSYPSEQQCD